jgi:hypothetical protein
LFVPELGSFSGHVRPRASVGFARFSETEHVKAMAVREPSSMNAAGVITQPGPVIEFVQDECVCCLSVLPISKQNDAIFWFQKQDLSTVLKQNGHVFVSKSPREANRVVTPTRKQQDRIPSRHYADIATPRFSTSPRIKRDGSENRAASKKAFTSTSAHGHSRESHEAAL